MSPNHLLKSIAVAALFHVACVPDEIAPDVVVRLPDRDCRAADTACAFDVGSLEVGAVGARAFDVVNLGDAPVSIVSVEILGDPNFSLQQAPTELSAAESEPIVFAFQAQAPTTNTASLLVTWAEPRATIEVALQAQGAVGSLTIDPLSCDFGDVPVGTSSQACVIALSNPGTVDLAIDDIAFTTPFNLAGLLILPVFVSPDAPRLISIVATPTTTGTSSSFASMHTSTFVTTVLLQVNGV